MPEPDLPEDFTIFRQPDDDWRKRLDCPNSTAIVPSSDGKPSQIQFIGVYSEPVSFLFARDKKSAVLYFARALACWCFAGKAISITLRLDKDQRFLIPSSDMAPSPTEGFVWNTKTKGWSDKPTQIPNDTLFLGAIREEEFRPPAASAQKTDEEKTRSAGE